MSPSHELTGLRRMRRQLEERVLRQFGMRQMMLREPNQTDAAALRRNIAIYIEAPALALNEVPNWGGSWEGEYAPATEPVFVSATSDERMRRVLADTDTVALHRELAYGYLAYVELRG